jgi:D-lactate dehydrogenase (cytochrome)
MTGAAPEPASRVETVVRELRERLGERLSVSTAVREQHGHDEGHLPGAPPDAVAFPSSTAEVVEIVRICARQRVPIMAFGTGTGLEGNVAALAGGVSVDLSRMDRILQVNGEDLDVVVQPGVTRKQLNEHLRDTGLFFPIDPGADASLGGMAATRASGTNAVRYGTMRDNVLALTVVLADGRVIRTARRARKSSAGYDLTRLFVGSEGTLGIITELTLRLYGMPEAMSSAVCTFPTVADAVNTVIQTIQLGIPVARIELLDEAQVDAVNRYSRLDLQVAPTLLLEFHGTEAGVREQAQSVGEMAAELGGSGFQWSTRSEERTRLWQARHDAAYAAKALKPGGEIWPTDVCVPISRLADCIEQTQQDIRDSRLIAPIVGHVGDGNFHVVLVVDPDDSDEVARATELNERLVRRALEMGGTCTGEHGIGYGKLDFLVAEHGEAVAVMRQIKRCLDPDNIMNPGKVVRV